VSAILHQGEEEDENLPGGMVGRKRSGGRSSPNLTCMPGGKARRQAGLRNDEKEARVEGPRFPKTTHRPTKRRGVPSLKKTGKSQGKKADTHPLPRKSPSEGPKGTERTKNKSGVGPLGLKEGGEG